MVRGPGKISHLIRSFVACPRKPKAGFLRASARFANRIAAVETRDRVPPQCTVRRKDNLRTHQSVAVELRATDIAAIAPRLTAERKCARARAAWGCAGNDRSEK